MSYRDKLNDILPPALLVAANVFVFGAATVYRGNADDFEAGLAPLLSLSAWLGLLTTAVIVLPVVFLPARFVGRYVAVWVCVGVVAWIQGNFLLGQYGVFDGGALEWDQPRWLISTEIALWAGLPIAGFLFWRMIAGKAALASWALIVCQSVVMLVVAFQTPDIWTKEQSTGGRPPSELYAYSQTRNVVHIILDSFQTDIFAELSQEPAIRKSLEGFTLFRGNMGVSERTALALPAVFGGRAYDGSKPFASVFDESVRSGLSSRLYDAGYRVNLVPDVPMENARSHTLYRRPSQFEQSYESVLVAETRHLLAATLFRHVPHHAKRQLFSQRGDRGPIVSVAGGSTRSLREKAFFTEYARSIHVAHAEPTYHFLHLWPPHPPFVTLANGAYAGRPLPLTRQNLLHEARSILAIFSQFLARLDEIGVYDSSLIVLHGDHGSEVPPVFDGKPLETCAPRMPALLAVKLPNQQGDLQISNAETSIADIPATILTALDLDHDLPGRSVFELDGADGRLRSFVRIPDGGRGARIRRYEVRGSLFDSASCRELPPQSVAKGDNTIVPGERIKFGLLGNAELYLKDGWSSSGTDSTWTSGHSAAMIFSLPPDSGDLKWDAEVRPFVVAGKLPEQRISVLANGEFVEDMTLNSPGRRRIGVRIPKSLHETGALELRFELPDAASRAQMGINPQDNRLLALDFYSMRLNSIPDIEIGMPVAVGLEENGAIYLDSGWGPLGDTTVSVGPVSELRLPIAAAQADLDLELDVGAYIKPPQVVSQRVVVSVNGVGLETWTGTTGAIRTIRVRIPASIAASGHLAVKLEFPDAVCPNCIGTGADKRLRAIDLEKIRLTRPD